MMDGTAKYTKKGSTYSCGLSVQVVIKNEPVSTTYLKNKRWKLLFRMNSVRGSITPSTSETQNIR